MDEPVRSCALEGCDEPVEPEHGRPQRLYCSAAHRLAARRIRRDAARAAVDAQLAETLPWLREIHPDGPAGPGTGGSGGAAGSGTDAPGAAGAVATGRAGPARGAGTAAVPEDGRGVARVRGARGPASRPGGTGAFRGTRSDPRHPAPRLRRPRTLLRHRRSLALVAATAVLLGGYALTAGPVDVEPPATQERSVDDWAGQARVALSSLDEQLGSLERAEQAWQRSPYAGRDRPAELVRLEQRRDTLVQQRAALSSQLDAYASRRAVADELALAEQQLVELEEIVAELPPPARRTVDQVAAANSLEEQRDLRARRRDACADELKAIDDGVERARRAPLPVDRTGTEKVSGDVLALARGDAPATPEPAAPRRSPQVLAGGRGTTGDRERDDVGTSGPPDPRGPVDETVPRAEGPQGASARGPGSAPAGTPGDSPPRAAGAVPVPAASPEARSRAGGDDTSGRGTPDAARAVARPGETLGRAASDAADGVASLTGGRSGEPGRNAGKRDRTDSARPSDAARGGARSGEKPGTARGAGDGARKPAERARGAGDAVVRGVGDTARGAGDTVAGVGDTVRPAPAPATTRRGGDTARPGTTATRGGGDRARDGAAATRRGADTARHTTRDGGDTARDGVTATREGANPARREGTGGDGPRRGGGGDGAPRNAVRGIGDTAGGLGRTVDGVAGGGTGAGAVSRPERSSGTSGARPGTDGRGGDSGSRRGTGGRGGDSESRRDTEGRGGNSESRRGTDAREKEARSEEHRTRTRDAAARPDTREGRTGSDSRRTRSWSEDRRSGADGTGSRSAGRDAGSGSETGRSGSGAGERGGVSRSAEASRSASRSIAGAVARPYVEAAMGEEAAAAVLDEVDRQAAAETARRGGKDSGGKDSGGKDSGGKDSGGDGSGSDRGDTGSGTSGDTAS